MSRQLNLNLNDLQRIVLGMNALTAGGLPLEEARATINLADKVSLYLRNEASQAPGNNAPGGITDGPPTDGEANSSNPDEGGDNEAPPQVTCVKGGTHSIPPVQD